MAKEDVKPTEKREGNMRSFRCADMGNADCRWEVSGRTNEELMSQIERHGREAHGMQSMDDNTRRKVQGAIRERAA